jgi:acetyltransferase-like isoleucine patch superfamily enzyme
LNQREARKDCERFQIYREFSSQKIAMSLMSGKEPNMSVFVHPSADVSPRARLACGVRVWNQAQVREDAVVGEDTLIGKDCYVDAGVVVGARCKLQNGVYLYHGVTVEDGVFLGPRATTTNDLTPRAIFPDGTMRGPSDFRVTPTRICEGAAIGAGAVLVCGITVGKFAMVAAGAVVTKDVPAYGLVRGNPARLVGVVCACGNKLALPSEASPRCLVCQAPPPSQALDLLQQLSR